MYLAVKVLRQTATTYELRELLPIVIGRDVCVVTGRDVSGVEGITRQRFNSRPMGFTCGKTPRTITIGPDDILHLIYY